MSFLDVLTSFAQENIPVKMWNYPFALQALLFDLFKHVTARAHATVKTPSNQAYSFLKTHCTSEQYRKYRKQYCMNDNTPTVISWAHYHLVSNVYCQDIVTEYDDYEALPTEDTEHTYSAIGSWTDDNRGHFVYCKQPITDGEEPLVFFLSYQDAHERFNNGRLLSMPRAYPYGHRKKLTQTFTFPSNDPLTYCNFTPSKRHCMCNFVFACSQNLKLPFSNLAKRYYNVSLLLAAFPLSLIT